MQQMAFKVFDIVGQQQSYPRNITSPLSLRPIGVNSSARTVDWGLISWDEGDNGVNSPCVQFRANRDQDRLPPLAAVQSGSLNS